MKNFYSWFFSLFSLLVLLTLSACQNKSKSSDTYEKIKTSQAITWGVKADTRLFGIMNIKTSQLEGFEIDLAKELSKKMLGKNIKVNLVQTTAKTKIPLLRNGSVDALLSTMTITKERKKIVDFSTPYFNAGQAILVPQNSKIRNVYDLNKNGITVLAVKGTTAVANIRKFAPKASVSEYDDYGQAFSALKAGQGQALTSDNGILAGIAAENPGFKIVGGTFTSEPYGIAVRKGDTKLRKKINQALAELKADGTYQKLLKKWFSGIPGFSIKEASR